MSKTRILVVDDEPSVRRYLRSSLTAAGYDLLEATSGNEAVEMAGTQRPELILLDLGLPDLDGVEVTRVIREWSQVPIVVLSVREHEAQKVRALDAGADDYLTKPFGIAELLARIRVALRHAVRSQTGDAVFRSGGLEMDLLAHKVSRDGQPIQLTPTEFGLLKVLVTQVGKVVTHRKLISDVWGWSEVDLHVLRVNISNLRRKIEPDPTRPTYVLTEPGIGYRIRVPEETGVKV